MFGIFRTLLALFVLIGHLYGPYQLGSYAVFGFYTLSGYLMTLIMRNSYGYHLEGRKKFLLNRILRIYPPYFVSLLISLLLLTVIGKSITQFESAIYFPNTFKEILQNIFLILFPGSKPRLSPSTWALTVELFFYTLICIGLSRTKKITIIWFCINTIYTIILCVLIPDNWTIRYFPIAAASLPFSIGALLFHFNEKIISNLKTFKLNNPLLWFILICINFCLSYIIELQHNNGWIYSFGFYINLALMSLCIISLISYKSNLTIKKIDTRIGRYSYPFYLIHWQAGAIVFSMTNKYWHVSFLNLKGVLFLITSLIISILLSELIIQFVDIPIEKVRNKIKGSTVKF